MNKFSKEMFRSHLKRLNSLLTVVNRPKVYQTFSPNVKSKGSFVFVGGFLCWKN